MGLINKKQGRYGFIVAVCLSMGFPHLAWTNADLDRQFRLESIGILKPSDNVDGLFSEYVEAAFQDYFEKQSRFIMNDLRVADSIFNHAKLPYGKIIFDDEILRQLAQQTHTDSLIRTQVKKMGARYTFTLDWLHAPRMELMSSVQFDLEEPKVGGFFEKEFLYVSLKKQLSQLIHQLPFLGQVSGRDNNSVLVSLSEGEPLKKGDVLEIATLDEVKKHPLLKKIVGWKLATTGRVSIEKVEDAVTFCKVLDLEPGMEIARYQKVIQIRRAQMPESSEESLQPLGNEVQISNATQARSDERPKLGWMGLSVPIGSYGRSFTLPASEIANTGGGISFGAQADGEVWLNQSWFLGGKVGYNFWNYSQNDTTGTQTPTSRAGGVSGSQLAYLANIGYALALSQDFYGPKGWIKLGYESGNTTLPSSTSENTGPFGINSIFAGVGANIPFLRKWGLIADFKLNVLSFVAQGPTLVGSSILDIDLFLGAYYSLNTKISIRGGFDYLGTVANFSNGSSISQKTITFAPSLLYYF